MILYEKHKLVTINAIIALGLTLVVNFSHLLYTISPPDFAKIPIDRYILLVLSQCCYFYIASFILLTIATLRSDYNGKPISFLKKILYSTIVCIVFYLFAPTLTRSGEFSITILSRYIIHSRGVLQCSLILVVSLLYGKIYELLYQRQKIVYENELLKNENLQNRYNILVSQINPHFFFNSLNSLALLVREKSNDKALDYISTLSDTFRYIISNGHVGLTKLEDELTFIESYKYLFEIRYEDKLFINIDVDPSLYDKLIPSLSLQPLIENAVKHNVITMSKPMTIDIRSEDHYLVVSNKIQAKLTPSDGTGIGLENLASRFILLSNKEIIIDSEGDKFIVKLPII